MPKKTKREKIIADYRKKLQHIQHHVHSSPAALTPTYQLSVRPDRPSTVVSSREQSEELTLIKQDIAKTLFFALLAVSVEFVLFWLWKK